MVDTEYHEKRADASKVARGEFLATTFLLGADRHQYRGMITQPRNDYMKGQHTYPATVQKVQALLKIWEGEKSPAHGSNEGLNFANVENEDDGDGGDVCNGDAQESSRPPLCSGTTEMCRCHY